MSRLSRVAVGVAGLALAVGIMPAASAAARHSRPEIVTAGPIRQLVQGVPGKSVAVRFFLTDLATRPVRVTGAESAFKELRTGQMVPALPSPGESGWLRFPGPVTLYPQHQVTITAHLALPRNAQPGDANLAATFTARPAQQMNGKTGTKAITIPAVLLEIVAHVPGKGSKHVVYGLSAGGLSLGRPVTLTATLTEHGTDYALINHLAITGAGHVALPGVLLLSGSTRTMSTSWQPPALCLPCTMRLGTASADVWAIPALPIGGVVLIVLAAGGGAVLLRTRHRKARSRRHGRAKPGFGPVAGQEGGIIDSR